MTKHKTFHFGPIYSLLFVFVLCLCSCTFWPGYQRKKTVEAICKCNQQMNFTGRINKTYKDTIIQVYTLSLDSLISIMTTEDPIVEELKGCLKQQGLAKKNIKRIDTDHDLYKMENCNTELFSYLLLVYEVRKEAKKRLRNLHLIN